MQYALPSYGQPQANASVPTQYQPIPQLHGAVNPVVSQPWLSSGGQSTTPVTPMVQAGQQPSTANANTSVITSNNFVLICG